MAAASDWNKQVGLSLPGLLVLTDMLSTVACLQSQHAEASLQMPGKLLNHLSHEPGEQSFSALQDTRRFLHAVYRVGDLDGTLEYYKKNFGMKQIRYRDIPEVCFASFLPEMLLLSSKCSLRTLAPHGLPMKASADIIP